MSEAILSFSWNAFFLIMSRFKIYCVHSSKNSLIYLHNLIKISTFFVYWNDLYSFCFRSKVEMIKSKKVGKKDEVSFEVTEDFPHVGPQSYQARATVDNELHRVTTVSTPLYGMIESKIFYEKYIWSARQTRHSLQSVPKDKPVKSRPTD